MSQSKLILVTGGARSGKSAFAERYAAALPGRHLYVATAQILDEEMKARVALHQKRRPTSWQTIEQPQGLAENMTKFCQKGDVILVDCLTLYFSNYLFAHEKEADAVLLAGALAEMEKIMAAVRQSTTTVIFVTNELGAGIVPLAKLSRLYRDLIGKINQAVAAEADAVYLTVCGLATELKSRAVKI